MKMTPRITARLAGALNVFSGVPDGFSIYVLSKLVVRGNPAATATNILASEGLFRLGFAAEVMGVMCFAAAMLLFYQLFKPVSRILALLMVSFGLIGSTIQVLDSLTDIAALLLLKGGTGLVALPVDQAQALALVFIRMHSMVYTLALVFIGASSVLMGCLALRSSFLPRVLGMLMMIDGLGFLTFSFATFLSPPFAAHLYPYLPFMTAILGEGPMMLWLIVKAVNAQRWEEQATVAAGRG